MNIPNFFLEISIIAAVVGNANIPARVKWIAGLFYFFNTRYSTKPFYIFILFPILVAITADNACDLLYLFICPIAMRFVYLSVDTARVNKKNFVTPILKISPANVFCAHHLYVSPSIFQLLANPLFYNFSLDLILTFNIWTFF